ncbi:PP2C family protein-serine/threonine phosphatase [Streptomyces caeni]|uniref:PP2C family protein-serine/threonine phosphatase n=1 Tax=Streptomyces caeni TaxID=2307231 RepID=A0ABW4J0T1_9ACTN
MRGQRPPVRAGATAALALQNSLLPMRLPARHAVEAAFSCPPGHAGGLWYDVFPLSGARVALTVGDVAGHGMRAVATMGRLRAATHSLAALDLAPDEVLAHLDDLMVRLAEEGREVPGTEPLNGRPTTATCVYAVYDPVSRRLDVARAGHPAPLLTHPDGRARSAGAPAGSPLGGDGLPFETWETHLPEGSLIALYTRGSWAGPRGRDGAAAAHHRPAALERPGGMRRGDLLRAVRAARGGRGARDRAHARPCTRTRSPPGPSPATP